MVYNPEKHHRRSVRLKNYDYAQTGAYFVTICSQNRECLFGNIRNGEMCLNDPGLMMKNWWLELANKFRNIEMDKYVIMPNHLHGIIFIVGADLCVCPDIAVAHDVGNHMRAKGKHTGLPLHRIIQWFKTMSTNDYLKNIHKNGWQRLHGKLWQRNYCERVIRDERELFNILYYIQNNPLRWDIDKENPENI